MTTKYVAFLRGINVGGHHKVPMADLRLEMEKLKFKNVVTLLNTGNIIFEANTEEKEQVEQRISKHLAKVFGFPIPTILRRAKMIEDLLANNPFQEALLTKEIRWYVSLLQQDIEVDLSFPWASADHSFKMIEKRDKTIISILDLSIAKTPKAMEALERYFGSDITTRNWKTIKRIGKKLEMGQ